MPTFRLTIAYDGTDFQGWQRQPNQRTIQGEMEAAFQRVTQQKVLCVASGRTDAGVHALGQVVGVVVDTRLDGPALAKALNAELPEDILIFSAVSTHDDFHAIREAVSKRYRYLIEDGHVRDLFSRGYHWHRYRKLDEHAMQRAARGLLGTHDFTSYQTRGSTRLTTERTVHDITVERRPMGLTERIVVEVEADGFLYNMVRNIVGTLVAVGHGRVSEQWPVEGLLALDRRKVGMTAPAKGLYLVHVHYDDAHPEHPPNPDAELEELPEAELQQVAPEETATDSLTDEAE